MQNLCIILINYNGYDAMNQILQRFYVSNISMDNIVVVDNCSSDGSRNLLSKLKKKLNFILLMADENLGFAAGNNIGINYALQNGYKYIALLNSDLSFDTTIFTSMLNFLDGNSDVGIVGPSLWNQHKLVNAGNKISYTKIGYDNSILVNNKEKIIDCDFLIGAFLVVRASALKQVGLMPECYFLNYEETEWELSFKKSGYRICCLKELRAQHIGGQSIGKINGMQVYFLRRNIVMFEMRNAPIGKKIIFFIKLFFFACAQSIYNGSIEPFSNYLDGITGRNKFHNIQ